MLARVERFDAAVERFLALRDAVLERAKLALALLFLRFRSLLVLDNLFFCLEKSFLLQGLCLSLRLAVHLGLPQRAPIRFGNPLREGCRSWRCAWR